MDENTGPKVARWLCDQGHEVFSVYEEARGMTDDEIMQKAFVEDRILITNDKDFGEMVYRERRPHKGVMLLRLQDERADNKIDTIRQFLEYHSDQLVNQFVVVTEKGSRFAKS